MRKEISDKKRFTVFSMDNFTCCYCGRSRETHGVILHVDHIKPVSKGGTNDLENLVTSCETCNLGKMVDEVEKEMIEKIKFRRGSTGDEDCTYTWYLKRLAELKANYVIESNIVYGMYKNWENNIEVKGTKTEEVKDARECMLALVEATADEKYLKEQVKYWNKLIADKMRDDLETLDGYTRIRNRFVKAMK